MEFSASLKQKQIALPGKVNITIQNHSRTAVDFSLIARDWKKMIRFQGQRGRIRLLPGQKKEITLKLEASQQQPLASKERIPFEVIVTSSHGERRSLLNTAQTKVFLPAAYWYVLIFVTTLIVTFSAMVLLFNPTVFPILNSRQTPTASSRVIANVTPIETASSEISQIVSATPTISPGVLASDTPIATPPVVPMPTNTSIPSVVITPVNTPLPTPSPTNTLIPTLTSSPSHTPVPVLTDTPTSTPTSTPEITPTDTPTLVPTLTPTSTPTNTLVPSKPVVMLMDGFDDLIVYDPETRDAEPPRSNADDIAEIISGLPIDILVEYTYLEWQGSNQIITQNPQLIIIHKSAFFEDSQQGWETFEEKFEAFLGDIADTQIQILIYSRSQSSEEELIAYYEGLYPLLAGRVNILIVERNDFFTWTAYSNELNSKVNQILGLN